MLRGAVSSLLCLGRLGQLEQTVMSAAFVSATCSRVRAGFLAKAMPLAASAAASTNVQWTAAGMTGASGAPAREAAAAASPSVFGTLLLLQPSAAATVREPLGTSWLARLSPALWTVCSLTGLLGRSAATTAATAPPSAIDPRLTPRNMAGKPVRRPATRSRLAWEAIARPRAP